MSDQASGRIGDRGDMVEVLGSEGESRRLAETYLLAGQLRNRAVFAALFGITQVAAALLAASVLVEAVAPAAVGLWAGAVALANIWVHARAVAPRSTLDAIPQDRRVFAEAILLSTLWIAFPAWSLAGQPLEGQLVLAGAAVAVIVSGVGLAAMPAAAIAFITVVTAGLGTALIGASEAIGFRLMLTFAGIALAAMLVVVRISRWTHDQLRQDADARAGAESAHLLLQEYEHRGIGWLWQTDANGRILYMSSRMADLLGRPAQALAGRLLASALAGANGIDAALASRAAFHDVDMQVRTRRGQRWIRLSGDPILDRSGGFLGYRGVGHDITDMRHTHERLTKLANHDMLCGVPNRGRMRQLIGDALERCGEGAACALLLIDLDRFKPVNDRFGHPEGDLVLKDVALRLRAEVGTAGQVGRIGGDEFAVILCDAGDRSSVDALAARLIAALSEPFRLDRAEVRIGASIGCAFGPSDAACVDELVQKADLALYRAKADGRGVCRFFEAGLQSEAERRAQLLREIKDGMKADQFRLAYQPLVDAASERLVGFEALLRWDHPVRGVLQPQDFLAQADESGLLVPLGEWVAQEAFGALAQWPDLILAINLSARQLGSPALVETLLGAMAAHRIAPDRLELDVTEAALAGAGPGATDTLRRLRCAGVGIVLDDFGTGQSSLGHLNKALFHRLKIDGSVVRGARSNPGSAAIIESMVALARSFRMEAMAEGVESPEDAERMRQLGCTRMQGFHFGRPVEFGQADAQVRYERQMASA